ncbi:MAG: T9SS type A sorting domain-containing protein [Chitinophagales bacterium]|nr:T9SS type A sorting domain-containing protein [Chitinophagales bacterium]
MRSFYIGILVVVLGAISTIGISQNVKPTWDYEDKAFGEAAFIFEEFGDLQKYLTVVEEKSNHFDIPTCKVIILDNDGQEIQQNFISNDSLDLNFTKSFYDPSTHKIRLFGFGVKAPFSRFDFEYFVTTTIDESGAVGPVKVVRLENPITSDNKQLGYSDIGYYFDGQGFKIVASSGWNILYYSDINDRNWILSFIDLSKEGDVLNMNFLDDVDICQCILPSAFDDGFHCPGGTGFNLDKNMNIKSWEANEPGSELITSIWPNTLFFQNNQSCFPWLNNTFLISNTFMGNYNNMASQGNTVVFQYSPKDYKLQEFYATWEGNDGFHLSSMDVAKDTSIYTGALHFSYLDHRNTKTTITKLDKELKKVWQMQYVEDHQYSTTLGIKATSDLGFVIYGYRTDDYTTGNYPFVTKFDSNGGLSWTNNTPNAAYTIKSYPTISSGLMTIDIVGIVGNLDVRVFDMAGSNVFVRSNVISGVTTLDLSGLSTGSYIYKVYQGSKELHSGKWIKQ